MDAINPINPSALFMVKGADQTIYTTNGGQGFVTDQQLITAAQCSNPNAFFRSLLSKSYSTQVLWLRSELPCLKGSWKTDRQLCCILGMTELFSSLKLSMCLISFGSSLSACAGRSGPDR